MLTPGVAVTAAPLNQGQFSVKPEWKETLLNGQPVEVVTEITVNFTLDQ